MLFQQMYIVSTELVIIYLRVLNPDGHNHFHACSPQLPQSDAESASLPFPANGLLQQYNRRVPLQGHTKI